MNKNFYDDIFNPGLRRIGLEKGLYLLSAYAVPVLIGLLSLIAIFFWKEHYPVSESQQIAFAMLEQQSPNLTPEQASARLKDYSLKRYQDTHLSEQPFWLMFTIRPNSLGERMSVELPSRHANSAACWDAASMKYLGGGDRNGSSGNISQMRAGFVLHLGQLTKDVQLLCRQTFTGPARAEVNAWNETALNEAAHAYERYAGLLEGGMTILGVFVLITALINRESTYLLFAAWLLINLRMAELSSGGDVQWLGHTIPPDWMYRVRLITTSLYYTLTFTLFRSLFRDELSKIGYSKLLRLTAVLCLPLMLCAALLPFKAYLPLLWLSTTYGTLILLFFLTRILVFNVTPVAIWYSASMLITLVASLYEVLSAALGIKGLIGTVNSVTAALSSSLLAALAIAAQLRNKHVQWIEAREELEHTYTAMPIGLFTLDLSGHITNVNPSFTTMVGADSIRLGEDLWAEFFAEGAWQQLHQAVIGNNHCELEMICKGKGQDEKTHFLVRATLARDKIEGSLQDITARARATAELQFMAHNDSLTKVLNRRGIEAVIEESLQSASETGSLLLAYLDLDRFKLINDLYGHPAGDEVLKQVCGRINAMLSGAQQVGRVGGDEFVLVFPDTPASVAIWVCRGIVESIGTGPYHFGDKAFQVRGSIGLIEVDVGTKLKDAISTADRACREAKSSPTGLIVYEKNASAFREREAELRLVEKISSAGTPEGLFLDMQPIMSLKNPHESLNFEVLLRMRDVDGTVIPAGRIITAAETSGRIGMIDRWVLATTLDWVNTHHATLTRTRFICMNLSGASLNDERFVLDAFDILERNRQAASMLCLEITESVALHDLENTRRFIDQVRSYGVRIALDDFGAGYTSFSYLKSLPAEVLKIDGSFIVNMNSHPANIAIVEAIVSLAGNLGMKTIAEWAEDNATVQTLVEIGVDYVQGYAVSRPQSPSAILAAESSASFIQDSELKNYAYTLSALTEAPIDFPPGVTLISSDGKLITK
jgi:diguanylate cyclase (GGDEF)-like protein